MSVKARLRILLLANEVLVAETDDEALWQEMLGRIAADPDRDPRLGRYAATGDAGPGRETDPQPAGSSSPVAAVPPVKAASTGSVALAAGGEPQARLAEELGLALEVVVGACDPSPNPPYMHLDRLAWEEFKRLNPRRGPAAVPPIVLAATLLALWGRHAGIASVTVNHTQALLETVDVRDKNPTRGLKNCEWLQLRDGAVKLNPARLERARSVARAFCAGQRVSG